MGVYASDDRPVGIPAGATFFNTSNDNLSLETYDGAGWNSARQIYVVPETASPSGAKTVRSVNMASSRTLAWVESMTWTSATEIKWTLAASGKDSVINLVMGDGTTVQNKTYNITGTYFQLPADSDLFASGTGVVRLAQIAVASLPSAATKTAGAMVYVTDEAGGAIPAFSDGTNWRRVSDRAVVS